MNPDFMKHLKFRTDDMARLCERPMTPFDDFTGEWTFSVPRGVAIATALTKPLCPVCCAVRDEFNARSDGRFRRITRSTEATVQNREALLNALMGLWANEGLIGGWKR